MSDTGNTGDSKRLPRRIVVPGEEVGGGELRSGMGTYREGDRIISSTLGITAVRGGYMNVQPLGGKYIPRPGDQVIGEIIDVNPTSWLMDINSPYPAPMHISEAPWRVNFGDTPRFLNVGDSVLVRISNVDEIKRVQVSMKEPGSRKLTSGHVIEISHSKVPRVIGKGGSMINLIKKHTNCRMFVGQNGRIWIDGGLGSIMAAMDVIKRIERDAQKSGLTEQIQAYLESREGGGY